MYKGQMGKGIKNYVQVIRMQSNVFLTLQLIDLAKKGDESGVYYLMQVWPFLFSFSLYRTPSYGSVNLSSLRHVMLLDMKVL